MPSTPPADLLIQPNPDGVRRAVELLNGGKLVALPTETVYGIAVNLASKDARDGARRAKTRLAEGVASSSPWVVHVARPDDVAAWVTSLSPLGHRLIGKALPGPVAFEIKLDANAQADARKRLGDAADETIHDGFLTLRCPDFGVTQDVLDSIKSPIALIGAGTAAQPGVYEAADLPAGWMAGEGTERVAGILNGGPTRYRKSSTLVRLDGEQFNVVRAGVIDERIIKRMADYTIVFLCSGNTCRSPMAAALASKIFAEKLGVMPAELSLRHLVVQSAGLHAAKGQRATFEAMDAVKELGGDLSTHFSQPASPDLLRRADIIYTMTEAHREEVMELFPWAARKTERLDPEGDVSDPFGSTAVVYQKVAKRLSNLLEKRLGELTV